MNLTSFAKFCLFSALTLMALAFGYSALMLGHHIAFTLAKLDGVIDGAGETMATVNRPCGGKQACGTLADVAKTLNTIRGTAAQAELAAAHENTQLKVLDRQEAELFADLHGTALNVRQATAKLSGVEDEASTTLRATTSALDGLAPLETNLALASAHTDALVTDPSIKRFLESSADTGVQVDGTATDIRRVADKVSGQFLNPPPKHWWNYAGKVWSIAWQAGMLAK